MRHMKFRITSLDRFSLSWTTVLLHLTLTCFGAHYTQKPWEITRFNSVTTFDGIGNYYADLRKKIADADPTPHESEQPEVRTRIKRSICRNILRSPYFRIRSEKRINVNTNVIRKELSEDRESLLPKNPTWELVSTQDINYDHENSYKLISTSYLDDHGVILDDYVFSCLVREVRYNNSTKEYLISREYNINLFEGAYPIVGRFLFLMNDEDKLVVQALAEESAVASGFLLRTQVIETFYQTKRRQLRATKTQDQDPVCTLSDINKLRLCASLSGASIFERSNITFTPRMDGVQLNCQKKEVKVRTPIFAPFFTAFVSNPHKLYREWVIGCTLVPDRGEPITYYVSRGVHHNTIFVFTEISDGRLFLFTFFTNVSVVGDVRAAAEIPNLL